MKQTAPIELFSDQYFPIARFVYHASKPSFLTFLIFEIFIIGAWLESEWGHDFIARSGAVIVVVALLILWVGIKYANELPETERIVEKILNDVLFEIDLHDHDAVKARVRTHLPAGCNVVVEGTDWDVESVSRSFQRIAIEGPENIIKIRTLSAELGTAQIWVAVIGTLIWAFGDFAKEIFC